MTTKGGVEQTVGQGRDTAPSAVAGDPRYQINNCNFTGDTQSQLTWNGGNPGRLDRRRQYAGGDGEYSIR